MKKLFSYLQFFFLYFLVNSSQKRKFFKRGYSECAKYPLHETKMGKTPLVQVVDKDKKCRKRSASDEPAGLTCKQKTKNVKQVEKGKLTQPTSPMTDSSSDIEVSFYLSVFVYLPKTEFYYFR